MIKKLKHKFILIFMIVTMSMLAGVLVFVGISTKKNLEQDCQTTLSNYLSMRQPPRKHGNNSSIILVLVYSPSGRHIGTIKNEETFPYTVKELDRIEKYCLEATEEYGITPEFPLAYMKHSSKHGTTYALYDLTQNQETLRHLHLSFLFITIVALPLLYLISLLLSRWCIRPVEESWKKQQAFIADASHELKTPLTVILANTTLLKETSSTNANNKYVRYIEEEANHMSHLVNDMLFLAKTDALRENVPMNTLDMSELCMNCYLPFESLAFEKNLEMNAEIAEDISLTGSSEKLGQLINILLDNACKYTPEHGKISFTLQQVGNMIHLNVSNTSAPISKDQLSHLFERFYRVDEARTRSGGYGLGLSIAHSIVQMHHGKIKISSSAETGTTVFVELPVS